MELEILKLKSEKKKNQDISNISLKESTQQEIKLLKQMMKSIEENSTKEKNYFQRQIVKKDEEINLLKYQIDQIQMNEKNLKNQIKFNGYKDSRK